MRLSRALYSSQHILTERNRNVGIITLNRPKALNSLSLSMVRGIKAVLSAWSIDSNLQCFIMKGSGGKAFCAGGDVREVRESGLTVKTPDYHGYGHRGVLTADFFMEEYEMNYALATNSKPQISFWDGFVMGGGAGVSIYGRYRIATENTVFAMPETAIGLLPDVGGSYWLSRLGIDDKDDNINNSEASLGAYIGLTGARLHGADLVRVGLATHFVPSSQLEAVQRDLMQEMNLNGIEDASTPPLGATPLIDSILNRYALSPSEADGCIGRRMGEIKAKKEKEKEKEAAKAKRQKQSETNSPPSSSSSSSSGMDGKVEGVVAPVPVPVPVPVPSHRFTVLGERGSPLRHHIDNCFGLDGKDRIEDVIEALQKVRRGGGIGGTAEAGASGGAASGGEGGGFDGPKWAKETLQTLSKMSPTSLQLTVSFLRRGLLLPDLRSCLLMEHRLSQACMRRQKYGPAPTQEVEGGEVEGGGGGLRDGDFYEGIRAVLVDKDRRPRWNYLPPLAAVSATATATTTTAATTTTSSGGSGSYEAGGGFARLVHVRDDGSETDDKVKGGYYFDLDRFTGKIDHPKFMLDVESHFEPLPEGNDLDI